MIQMDREFITENQLGRAFWYLSVCHATMMFNQVPGLLGLKLITWFELFHNAKPDSKTWFELFSIGYFNHDTENDESCSKVQSYTLDGIAVRRDESFNYIIFYNTLTSSYYCPTDFRLDKSRLPITNFPISLRFDGSFTYGLLRNKTNPIHEPLPPGTRVSIKHDNVLASGTIKNTPIIVSSILKCVASPSTEQSDNGTTSTEPQESPPYVILLDSGITVENSYDNFIQAGQDDASPSKSTRNSAALEGIPHFLCHDSKIMMDHKGALYKGYIKYSPEFGFQFIVR